MNIGQAFVDILDGFRYGLHRTWTDDIRQQQHCTAALSKYTYKVDNNFISIEIVFTACISFKLGRVGVEVPKNA